MESVEPVLGIANCLGPPICKYLRYHRKLNDYVRKFKSIRDELNSKMEDVELQLKVELLHPVGKIPKKVVENWLEKSKAMISEAQDVETRVTNGRYLRRASNGKLVDEKTQEMQTFLDKAPNVSESLIIDAPSPTAGLPLPTSELVGEKVTKEEIWTCLMGEEESKIGVWGMGGVGKTTIMKHIHNDLLKEERFERIIWVTVSKEFNIVKLQDDIATALNLKEDLAKEGDKLRRAAILLDMIKKAGKHVLILDDVWGKVSLEEVGIPEPSSSNGCKLVLTSRLEQVCKYMGCKVTKVKPLSEEEALILFLNKVGSNLVHNQSLMPTLRLVVKECAGLPLTILVVAGTLKGEDDRCIWTNALKELKERIGNVEGAEAEVIERLKFSFDHLKDVKVKHCFLYCALYPEDYKIERNELIESWIDEGFIDEMKTRQEMKHKGHAILKKLENNSLLENANEDGWASVKMHDAVRDMALSITGMYPRCMVLAGLQLIEIPEVEEWTEDIERVSLIRSFISKIPIDMPPPNCQLLKTLLLQHNPIKNVPNSFFANMPCLGVLNLSSTNIECLPNSISELENLTTLLLGYCYQLRHVPCLAKLQRLKKLDLNCTSIEEVPEGMDMLINLRYLDLRAKTLKGIPVGLLPKLSHLQYLRFDLSNERTRLKGEDVVPLGKLGCIDGCFESIHELNEFVSSMQQQCKKNLTNYQLLVGSCGWGSRKDKTVSINEFEVGRGELMLPNDIQYLRISNCHYLRSLSDDDISSLKNAIDLRDCVIEDCKGIEYVVSSSSVSSSCTTHLFQSLEGLYLMNLPNLRGVMEEVKQFGSGATTSMLAPSATFSHLKKMHIENCGSMKTLLPHWLFSSLRSLEKIRVEHCEQIVEIFGGAPTTSDDGSEIALIKYNLPKLRELRLNGLPELKSICSKSGVMVCDSLELIAVIDGCSKLKKIPPFVPRDGNEQPYEYVPAPLKIISTTEWWELLEWDDHSNFKNLHFRPL